MTDGQTVAAGLAAFAVFGAVIAGVVDWRQKRRCDLDRVSLLDWRTMQLAALGIVIAAAAFGLHAG